MHCGVKPGVIMQEKLHLCGKNSILLKCALLALFTIIGNIKKDAKKQ